MLWEEYYDNIGIWAASTAVSRMSKLESFGPPDQIIEAVESIALDDEKGAIRLLKKALSAGITFSGENLADICLICNDEIMEHAVRLSAPHFTPKDLDALYYACETDLLLELAKKYYIPLPKDLAEDAETEDEDAEAINESIYEDETEYEEESMNSLDIAAEYDYILDHLSCAHRKLTDAYRFAAINTSRKYRAITVVKYAKVCEAQDQIAEALRTWDLLDIPDRSKTLLRDIWPNISDACAWQNYLFEGFFTNLMVQRRIRKVLKNIEIAIRKIRGLRDAL